MAKPYAKDKRTHFVESKASWARCVEGMLFVICYLFFVGCSVAAVWRSASLQKSETLIERPRFQPILAAHIPLVVTYPCAADHKYSAIPHVSHAQSIAAVSAPKISYN